MKVAAVAVPVLAGIASAKPVDVEARQACPEVHIFGARETTVPQEYGYGTAQGLVDMVKQAYPGATSEAIVYPACGGQPQCGGIPYEQSASQGTQAVVQAVTQFNQNCPNTKIVLIGYSQGGQIMDNALCGGAGATLTGAALEAVKAAIFMGDPHNVVGLPYNVGTCQGQGVSSSCLSRVVIAARGRVAQCLGRSGHIGGLTLIPPTPVRRSPARIPVLAGQPGHHPVILRRGGSLLLQRLRHQPSPAVRQHLRPGGAGLYPAEARLGLKRVAVGQQWRYIASLDLA